MDKSGTSGQAAHWKLVRKWNLAPNLHYMDWKLNGINIKLLNGPTTKNIVTYLGVRL
jgi:hypothetical protein